MEINKNIYLVIGIIGFVFSSLTYFTQGENSAYTVLFLFVCLLLCLKLQEEYFYYKGYRAPLASGIFLLIPSAIALGASFISRIAILNNDPFLQDEILIINLDLSFISFQRVTIFLNYFNVIFALPFYGIVLILLYRYYYGIYPRLFIFKRKFFKQFAMYYNLVFIAVIITFFWSYYGNITIIELIFVIVSIIFIIQAYVLKIVLVPVRIIPFSGRSRSTSSRRANTIRSSSPQRSVQPTQNTQRYQSSSRERSPTPIRLSETTSSTPLISISSPNRNRTNNNNTQTRSTPVRQRKNQKKSNITVVEGLPIQRDQSKAVTNIDMNAIKEYIPIAQNLTKNDFKCIFCYELPTKSNDNLVICPNCRKPAHYNEYRQWSSYSSICSYCNQDTASRGSPRRITGKNYSKIINLALKRKSFSSFNI